MLSDGEDGKGPERGKKLIRTGKSRRGSSRSRISTNARKMTPGSHWTNSQGSLIAETDDFEESPGCSGCIAGLHRACNRHRVLTWRDWDYLQLVKNKTAKQSGSLKRCCQADSQDPHH